MELKENAAFLLLLLIPGFISGLRTPEGHNQPSDQLGGTVGTVRTVRSPTDPAKSWAKVAAAGSSNKPKVSTPTPPSQPNYCGQPIPGPSHQAGRPSEREQNTRNPVYSTETIPTDEDLEKLSEFLFAKDVNNATTLITLNMQNKIVGTNEPYKQPQPLFSVQSNAYGIPTVQRICAIRNTYQVDVRGRGNLIQLDQKQQQNRLVEEFTRTKVMIETGRFLRHYRCIGENANDLELALKKLWFTPISREEGKTGSTGFEHVFMAELKPGTPGPEVLGLHNWIYFSLEEVNGNVEYHGFRKTRNLGTKASIVKVHATFKNHPKLTTMFVGTSPELEMALYTACFYARPNKNCPVSLGGAKFNILTYQAKYQQQFFIRSAYPVIDEPTRKTHTINVT